MLLRSTWMVHAEVPKPATQRPTTTAATAISWLATVEPIFSFVTAVDFWGWFDHCVLPSAWPSQQLRSLRVFKHGVSLLAEDEANAGGGRLLLDCSALAPVVADEVWGRALVFAVSEAAGGDLSSYINGVVATLKRAPPPAPSPSRGKPVKTAPLRPPDCHVRVEVWLHSDATSLPLLIPRLTEALRSFILRVNVPITYQPHQQGAPVGPK